MGLKIGDKVKNKINGKKGKITNIYYGEDDMDIENGIYNDNYKVEYDDNKKMWNSVAEIEKIQDILDEDEKEYLSNIIKPFKDRVKFIFKREGFILSECEYIIIDVLIPDDIAKNEKGFTDAILLPMFKKNTMYKGMETYKKYTLKELNLD